MLTKLVRLYKTHLEMVRYFLIGIASTIVNWSIYGLMVRLVGFSITVANALAWITAVIFAFFANKVWVFKSRSWKILEVFKEAVSFFAFRAASGVLEILGVPLLVSIGLNTHIFGIEGFAAKLIISIVVIILNYIFSKLFVFRRKT